MTEEKQQEPIEEAGGYGTPTAEQELPGADTKKFAQPRRKKHSTPQGSARTARTGKPTRPAPRT